MSVVSVNSSAEHRFSKEPRPSIKLLAHLGIEGDAHLGEHVQHLSRIKIQPPPPNLRQVHLLHDEFFDEVSQQGKQLGPGGIGENITTHGIDLLGLGAGTLLHFVKASPAEEGDAALLADQEHAIITVTGLRNPCPQIEKYQPGLQELCIVRGDQRKIVERKSGIMATVAQSGTVRAGDRIIAVKPDTHVPLEVV